MSEQSASQLLIRGVTSAGKTFRPSDWAERLSGILSTFDIDSRINYSPYVHPTIVQGTKSIVVDNALEELDSRVWQFLISFAKDNDLVIEPYKP